MADQAPHDPTEKSPKGYGKRPLWQLVVLYLIVGAVVYGLVYYFFFMPSGNVSY
jgi:hypothetical protein